MSIRAAIQELARQVRRDTLDILLATPQSWLTYAPPGTSNHILWHAGHSLWLADKLGIELLTGSSELPPTWPETFGMNCRPPAQTKQWPDRRQLAELLQQQGQRLHAVLAESSEKQLLRIADPARGTATVASRIIHGLHDEAKHSGEMYLLFKLCRAGG